MDFSVTLFMERGGMKKAEFCNITQIIYIYNIICVCFDCSRKHHELWREKKIVEIA